MARTLHTSRQSEVKSMRRIVLFDGECNLCDASVQFILKRDPSGMFHFTSLQSEIGQSLLLEYNIPATTNSFLLLEGEHYFTESTAALKVARNLSGFWKLFYFGIVIPKPLRDVVYKWIAKNRYKWFGKKQECMLPTPEQKGRFLIDKK